MNPSIRISLPSNEAGAAVTSPIGVLSVRVTPLKSFSPEASASDAYVAGSHARLPAVPPAAAPAAPPAPPVATLPAAPPVAAELLEPPSSLAHAASPASADT